MENVKGYLDAQSKSEVRDGMRIDWDVPITMDDGLVLRADVYRPIREGKYPVILTYGPYGKWLHFEDLYTDQWRADDRAASGRPRRLHQQVPELGGGRSGEVGAGRLRLRPRGLARRRPLAGLHRPLVGARGEGLLPLHRVGRRAAVVATARSA